MNIYTTKFTGNQEGTIKIALFGISAIASITALLFIGIQLTSPAIRV